MILAVLFVFIAGGLIGFGVGYRLGASQPSLRDDHIEALMRELRPIDREEM